MPDKIFVSESFDAYFHCPGCNGSHAVRVVPGGPHSWGWNKNLGYPTFTPSVLVTGSGFTEKGEADYNAWYAAGCQPGPPEFESRPTVCHSFVTDGKIQFLDDCTHSLKGQIVDLPDWES